MEKLGPTIREDDFRDESLPDIDKLLIKAAEIAKKTPPAKFIVTE